MRGEALIGRLGVAVAVICATAVTVTAVALAMPSVRTTLGLRPAAPKASYAPGQTLDLPRTVFQEAPHTLVIFFRPDCGACERLKPFLNRLAVRSDPASLRVVAVTGAPNRPAAVDFVKQIGLDESHLVTMDLRTVRVSQVPTLVLVDHTGTVEAAIQGIPTSQEEGDLLRTVTLLSQAR